MGRQTLARDTVRRWFERNTEKHRLPIRSIRHVHSRAVVVGYAAPLCLIVRSDWRDSEKHMREFDRENPLDTVHRFDRSLREGDACVTAYVRIDGCGETVAVRAPQKKRAATKSRSKAR